MGLFGTDGQENLRNRVAYTTIEDFDDADDDTYQYATHYSYDIHGNVDRLVQENPGLDDFGDNNRFKLIEYEYDLISGNVNKVHYQTGKEDQFHHKYYYDADNRLLAVFTSRDNHIWDKDARYFYYRHGPLARTEIGDLKVQGVDYAYTIHGWLKGVNATALNTAKDMGKDAKYAGPLSSSNSYVGSDAFGFVLDYFKGDYSRINTSAPDFVATQQSGGTYYTYYDPTNTTAPDLWNGNIRGMSTALMDPDHVKVDVLGKSYQYDQLNRIKTSYSFEKPSMHLTANFSWVGVSTSNNWNTSYTYDPNGNLTTMNRSGNDNTAYDMDQFTYHYYQGTENSNRLKYVSDAATGTYSEDIDDQTGAATDNNNYEYDDIGNLTKDVTGDLENIEWTVYGKIREIEKGDGTLITLAYDPMGQRIMKKVDPTSGNTIYTYYLRDAQGNNMATYERIETETTDELFLAEQYVYGSYRVGYVSLNYEMVDATPSSTNFIRKLGEKRYELSNHLGNVLAVVTDRLYAYQEASPYTNHVKYYEADVVAAQDYDPFGILTQGRNWEVGIGYKYGFNTQEQIDEVYGNAALNSAEFWAYDMRLGRRWNLDPITFSDCSGYSVLNNSPILNADFNGAIWESKAKRQANLAAKATGGVAYESHKGNGDWHVDVENTDYGEYLKQKAAEGGYITGQTLVFKSGQDRSQFLREELGVSFWSAALSVESGWGWIRTKISSGDSWVHSDAGETFGRNVANMNPGVAATNIISGISNGNDIYGVEMEGWDYVDMSLSLIPGEGMAGKSISTIIRWSYYTGKILKAAELIKRLGVTMEEYHRNMKPILKKDFAAESKKLGTTNPDFSIGENGNVVVVNPTTGKAILTDVPFNIYK